MVGISLAGILGGAALSLILLRCDQASGPTLPQGDHKGPRSTPPPPLPLLRHEAACEATRGHSKGGGSGAWRGDPCGRPGRGRSRLLTQRKRQGERGGSGGDLLAAL